jgi:hypothetical protein
MNQTDVISRLIETQQLEPLVLDSILQMTPAEMIHHLIGLKGGFVFRAYLLERLMELSHGPRGIAVPEEVYTRALKKEQQAR